MLIFLKNIYEGVSWRQIHGFSQSWKQYVYTTIVEIFPAFLNFSIIIININTLIIPYMDMTILSLKPRPYLSAYAAALLPRQLVVDIGMPPEGVD